MQCLLIVLLVPCALATRKFPTQVIKCHQSNPNFDKCTLQAAKDVQKILIKGIPEFLLPPMNPLFIPKVSLNAGDSFDANFKNIEIYSAHDFVPNNVTIDLKNNLIHLNLTFPHLRIKSDYSIRGKILFLQLNGKGHADGNLTNINIDINLEGVVTKKANKNFLEFIDMQIEDKITKAHFQFSNLFPNNPELTEQTNKILNDNFQDILTELKPVLDETIKATILQFIRRIFSRFSINELFPK